MDHMLLPPTRTWPEDVEQLAQLLLDGAHASGRDREVEAALSLLFYEGNLFHRNDIRRRYILMRPGYAEINWQMLFADRYELPMSQDQRAVIALACSMGDGAVYINIPNELRALEVANTRHFLDVIRHLVGR